MKLTPEETKLIQERREAEKLRKKYAAFGSTVHAALIAVDRYELWCRDQSDTQSHPGHDTMANAARILADYVRSTL